eukprot:12666-Heterococcus_DN1.PRE.1
MCVRCNVLCVLQRCYERHILDVVFERYREADVAVEECEHQLQDLNMVSVRTQRPFKLLFKPHNFSGGSYIGEANASASTTSAAASSTAKVVSTEALVEPRFAVQPCACRRSATNTVLVYHTACHTVVAHSCATAGASSSICLMHHSPKHSSSSRSGCSAELLHLEATILRACDRIGTYTQLGRNHARKTMDIQFARPRDAVAAADDLQYMFAIISSSRSSKTRPCKVLLKPRSFAGFGAATS